MTADIHLYPLIIFSSFFGGICSGITGFGVAILFLMIWSISSIFNYPGTNNLTFPVALQTILSPILNGSLLYLVGKYHLISTIKLTSILIVGMMIGWPIGLYGLIVLPLIILKTSLGVFFLLFVIWRVREMYLEYHLLLEKERIPSDVEMNINKSNDEINQIKHIIATSQMTPIDLSGIAMDNSGKIYIVEETSDYLPAETPIEVDIELDNIQSSSNSLFGDNPILFDVPIRSFSYYEYTLAIIAALMAGIIGGAFGILFQFYKYFLI